LRWFSPLALLTRAFGQIVIISYVPLSLARSGSHFYLGFGLIYALPFVMQLIFAPLWGNLLDRRGNVAQVAAVGYAGYALMELGTAFAPGIPAILSALAVGGVFGAALSPAAKWHSLRLPDGTAHLSQALQGEAGGWLAGAILPAALSYLGVGLFHQLAFIGVATLALAAVSLGSASSLQHVVNPPARTKDQGPALLRSAWLPLFGVLLQFLSGEVFFSFYGVYLTTYLKGPLWLYSLTLAGTTAIGLWLYTPALRLSRRIGPQPVLLATSLWYLVSYLALYLAPSVPLAAIVFTVPAFSFLRIAASLAFAQAAPNRSGTAMGAFDAAEGLACSLGGPISGAFVGALGLVALPLLPLAVSVLSPWPLLLARRRAAVPSATGD
jgi:hypothetical protein